MKRLALFVLLVACTKQQDPQQPQPQVLPTAASAVPTFPPIDDACNADSDCTTTGLFGTCCGNCEQRYANNDYVTRARAYCAANPAPSCPPMGCSWGMDAVKCIDGKCQASARTRVTPVPR